jgi:uncharacterized protein (DUF1800 family)
MKLLSLITVSLLVSSLFLHAENNVTKQKKAPAKASVKAKDTNISKKKIIEEKIKEQMEREKKYAKEQRFYQGSDYDLKAHEVDPNTLPDVPVIEPDYDFDITDVYRDDL